MNTKNYKIYFGGFSDTRLWPGYMLLTGSFFLALKFGLVLVAVATILVSLVIRAAKIKAYKTRIRVGRSRKSSPRIKRLASAPA